MVWKSAKLLIAFYRDKNQRKRRIPYPARPAALSGHWRQQFPQ